MSDTISAMRGHQGAMAFARKGGSEFGAMLYSIALTKQLERKGPITSMLFLETHFDYDELPIVGSKMGETGNRPYDRYSTKVKTESGERSIPGSWFTDVVKSTPQAGSILQEIEWAGQGQGEGIPPHILEMGSARKKEYIKEQRQLLTDMRTALTKGAQLWHQLESIGSMNTETVKVKLPVMVQKNGDGTDGQVVTGNLIRLQDPSGVLEDESVTVGQFLQYDADKASKDPDKGTIKSLKATADRAPRKPGGTVAGKAYTVPANLEQGKTLFNVLATWVDNTTDQGKKVESILLSAMAKEGAEGDELVESVGKVCLALDSLWTVIQPRYDAIERRKAAAIKAA